MSSADLNRYIKEHLKRQPKTLSMSQIEELIEYDAWLDEQRGLTQRALDFAPRCPKCNAIAGWHHEACEDYSPETQSQ